jgi:hypothetical protein
MIAFLLILFFRRIDEPAPRAILWGRAFAFQKMVLVLFAVMPLPSLFHLWDHYLSSALYSGNINSGVLFLNDAVFDRLPDKIEDYVTEEGAESESVEHSGLVLRRDERAGLSGDQDLQERGEKNCSYALNDPSVELVVQEKLAFVNGNRRSVYRCADVTNGGRALDRRQSRIRVRSTA